MDKAILYCRVSTDKQEISIEAQEQRLVAYCTAKGLEIAHIIKEEGVSGSVPFAEREGGRMASRLLKRGTHLVAVKLDRLFRNTLDCLGQVDEWKRKGIHLHVLDISIDTSSAMGEMFLTICAAFANMERRIIGERTSTALQHKKHQRQVFSRTPYGYSREGNLLIPVEPEQEVLRRIHSMRKNGSTLQSICDKLNSEGVSTKRGSIWRPSTLQSVFNANLVEVA